MEYKYEVVEAGADTESGIDASPNNTLLEIADIHNKNKNILVKLNPHLLTTGILRAETEIKYKKSDGTDAVYKVPAKSHIYTLLDVAEKTKVNTDVLINDNIDVLAEHCCFDPGRKVLYSVGSMTDDINTFVTEQYLVTEKKTTLLSISLSKKIELSTLLELNPNIGQLDVLPLQSIVLLSVKSHSDKTTVVVTGFGLQANTTRTLFVTWEWEEETNKTESYEVKWSWMSSDGRWWIGNESTTKDGKTKTSTYNAESLAVAVKVSIKPNGKSGKDYTWSSEMHYNFGTNPATTPGAPIVELKKYTLTASVDGINIPNNQTHIVNSEVIDNTLTKIAKTYEVYLDTLLKLNPQYTADTVLNKGTVVILSVDPVYIEFEIVRDHVTTFNNSGLVQVFTGNASYSCTIEAGSNYKVRCRSYVNGLYSIWSEYSGVYNALPTTPYITRVQVVSETDVILDWTKINSAEAYTFEYVAKSIKYEGLSKEQYFDNPAVSTNTFSIDAKSAAIIDSDTHLSYRITGLLETGAEYFVRMNASNSDAQEPSKWSEIATFILGTKPTSPTTWSSTTVGVVGDSLPIRLYWTHNSEDGSIESRANIRLTVDGVTTNINVIKSTDKDKRDETSFYELDMDDFSDGSKIEWEVQTAGVLMENGSLVYGDWSIKRVINIYAPPTLSMNLYDNDGMPLEKMLNSTLIYSFPFKINLQSNRYSNQKTTGYHVSILANEDYTTVDGVGNTRNIIKGSKVFNRYIDTSKVNETVVISANDVNLVNNKQYIIESSASMSSGLTATSITYVTVRWNVVDVVPFAEVTVDKKTLTAAIYPFVSTEEEVSLSVYRREFDGSFTEIIPEMPNDSVVIDPHPALDYARYRIVAVNQKTGAVNYNDIPGIPVEEKAIVIQWDEEWRGYDAINNHQPVQTKYASSSLKLPYNIDVSNNHSKDASLVKYIGRKRSVSYYGTHLGETATWNTVIPKSDTETLYALRRLAVYMGNVYVREPSGSGYWANINVSFSQKHLDLSIPVTIDVTPVEGGM